MPAKPFRTLAVQSRGQWREWLREHQDSEAEIWLVFPRRQKAETSLSYDDAVEEALCFGWIDSLVKRLDDDRYARKFTPRKPNSRWSTINRRRYADLLARGLLAARGRESAPTGRSGDSPLKAVSELPAYIEAELKNHPAALANFERLAPSYRRAYIGWIDSAKRVETKGKRLREAIGLLAAGKKLGLK